LISKDSGKIIYTSRNSPITIAIKPASRWRLSKHCTTRSAGHLCALDEVGERRLLGLKVIVQAADKVRVIQEHLQAA